ncbi:protein-tyrosine phosphatase [Vibrio xiamenensis]|uniref:protein-tyrosine-phosphatase n=1 Tax=Vibrio xiamenensis TaxID=861298 RepID=A0A1G8AEJ7_9VIBR|nr:low molecular weight protein-tyrosine-phosphatase [Vibrio xiamenensis]SDH19321.1 protein-tyrosine phosphatase [Vibrio xiamenensis]
MFNHILVVCAGNICRSPVAEKILQQSLPNKNVFSAGLVTEKSRLSGHGVYPPMAQAARDKGIILNEHKAQQLTQRLCDWSDLILVMEHNQIEQIANVYTQTRNKTFLLGQWAAGSISDPYGGDKQVCLQCSSRIEHACQAWVARLS